MKRRPFIVALDGPSGAGKSTLARELSKRLGFLWVDTGAIYRCFGLAVWRAYGGGVGLLAQREGILSLLSALHMGFGEGGCRVFLNGEDVSEAIRKPEVSLLTSELSAWPEVRAALLGYQRTLALAASRGVILDGRDIGTVVFPDADLKFFITAVAEERARRRQRELAGQGIEKTVEEVFSEQGKRDRADSQRVFAPLRQAEGAHILDTSEQSLEQVIDGLEREVRRHWEKAQRDIRHFVE
ncbi:MAG: (d)CMP kinase [Proteobacteria bacterium]|nr:(d)CMP kinase [Cystobacterineae bacterium]MCL2258279.1 (d)CMP kinase [Cystobacterineae bacterium]MCL2315376.1 (d)CMP kinase [Pseudomonadota bacterium]